MNKTGQSGGMVTGLIFGVASLVIGVIVAFVLVSTLTGSGLLAQDSITVSNEAGHINTTTYTLAGASYEGATGFAITRAVNTTSGQVITAGNYTVGTTTGIVSNTSVTNWVDVTFNYTYSRDSSEIIATDRLSGNFTSGVNEVSSKIPTILLVAAIVLILGVLAVLVEVWRRMRMSGGNL